MENPFKNFSQKDWLYVGGAVASIVALFAFIAYQKNIIPGPGAQTDTILPPGATGTGSDAFASPNYLEYNVGDVFAPPIQQGADTAPNVDNTSCCCANNDCAGNSPLGTGDTFSGLNALLTYYQNTNPNYVALQQVQLQQYAAYFASGEAYSGGAIPIAVSPIG